MTKFPTVAQFTIADGKGGERMEEWKMSIMEKRHALFAITTAQAVVGSGGTDLLQGICRTQGADCIVCTAEDMATEMGDSTPRGRCILQHGGAHRLKIDVVVRREKEVAPPER